MRNSLERAFANQVHQYHHDYRERRNAGANADNFKTLQPVERDQGGFELPEISQTQTPMKNGGESAKQATSAI